MECTYERVTLVDKRKKDDGCGWIVHRCNDCGIMILSKKYETAPNVEMSNGFPKDAVTFRDIQI